MTTKFPNKFPKKAELDAYLEKLPQGRYINPSACDDCVFALYFKTAYKIEARFLISAYHIAGDFDITHKMPPWAVKFVRRAMEARTGNKQGVLGNPWPADSESMAAFKKRRGVQVSKLREVLATV
jgi:hypothetical protein